MKQLGKQQKETYLDLFYMIPANVTGKEIALFLKESQQLDVDYWEAVDVLEITLSNQSTLDFEPVDINFKDPSDASFVRNRKIQTIFGIYLKESDLSIMLPHFEALVEKFTGFICGDTADFKPVYTGNSSL